MHTAALVRRLYEAYDARAWREAAELLALDATVEMPSTAERLVGRGEIVQFQAEYPEPWGRLTVLRVVDGGKDEAVQGDVGEGEAAAELEIVNPEGTTWRVAAFWAARNGELYRGVEYFVQVGAEDPPAFRTAYPK